MTQSPGNGPPIGSFGLSVIGGRTGFWVRIGQAIIGDTSRYTHAFIVVSDTEVIEAMPSGARLAPLANYRQRADLANGDVRFCDAPVQHQLDQWIESRMGQLWGNHDRQLMERYYRAATATAARKLVGRRYSFADYLALALAHFGIRPAWLQRYIADSGRLICSQLVDETYRLAGIHLFDDERLPQDVTPGDLDAYRVAKLEAGAES